MRNIEDLSVETLDVREMSLYEGQRIAGTSDDVVNAVLTREYRFADKITIRVIDIPARLDRVSGKTYLSGSDGKMLIALVRRYLQILREKRAQEMHSVVHMPVRMTLSAPTDLAA